MLAVSKLFKIRKYKRGLIVIPVYETDFCRDVLHKKQ